MIRCTIATAAALAVTGLAFAKLPPLDDAAKAKAAEAAAKAAWQGKVDSYQLCKMQDKIAAAYRKTAAAAGKSPSGTMAAATPAAGAPANAAAAGAVAAAAKPVGGVAPAAAAAASAPTSASASQGGGTPVAGVGTAAAPSWPGCADPGPFAYAPADQKPLEASGAHSPAGNATSPPSNRATSAEMAPSKPGVAKP